MRSIEQKRKRLFYLEPGFTLIELLITSLAVGLILTIGLANYTRIRRQQAFHQAVKDVLADMRLAQDKAISGEKPTDCRPSPPAEYTELIGYLFEFSDTGDSYQIRALCQGLGVEPLCKEVTIASDVIKTSGPNTFLFQVLTRGVDLDNPSETLTFTDSSGSLSEDIVITRSGEIYPEVGPTAPPGATATPTMKPTPTMHLPTSTPTYAPTPTPTPTPTYVPTATPTPTPADCSTACYNEGFGGGQCRWSCYPKETVLDSFNCGFYQKCCCGF